MVTTDQKIRTILRELNVAVQDYSKRFIEPIFRGKDREDHDFFTLALAQDKVNLLETQYHLALAEETPGRFTPQELKFLKKEEVRFTKRLRAWENRQFPTRE